MREIFLELLQRPRDTENSNNIMRLLTILTLGEFQQIMETSDEKEILRKALFEPPHPTLIDAMQNKIDRFGDENFSRLFFDFIKQSNAMTEWPSSTQNGRVTFDCDVGLPSARVENFTDTHEGRMVRFKDSDYKNMTPLEIEDRFRMAKFFIGQRNTDVPVSFYLDFFRSYLENKGYVSARNMVAIPHFSRDQLPQNFFHLDVDPQCADLLFELQNRLFVLTRKRSGTVEAVDRQERRTAHFVLTPHPTTTEAISAEFPEMFVCGANFQYSREMVMADRQAFPVSPAPPVASPNYRPTVFSQSFFVGLPQARVGVFSPVAPQHVTSQSYCDSDQPPIIRTVVAHCSSMPLPPGREVIPPNAVVPKPSFLQERNESDVKKPTAVPSSDPLAAAFRGIPMR